MNNVVQKVNLWHEPADQVYLLRPDWLTEAPLYLKPSKPEGFKEHHTSRMRNLQSFHFSQTVVIQIFISLNTSGENESAAVTANVSTEDSKADLSFIR